LAAAKDNNQALPSSVNWRLAKFIEVGDIIDVYQNLMRASHRGVRTSDRSRDNLGIISCVDTTLQKLPPHLSRRMARESDSLLMKGKPKPMHRTDWGGKMDLR